MDWMRYQRATEAQRIIDVEAKRATGDTKEFTPAEWAAILEHDRLLEEYIDGGRTRTNPA